MVSSVASEVSNGEERDRFHCCARLCCEGSRSHWTCYSRGTTKRTYLTYRSDSRVWCRPQLRIVVPVFAGSELARPGLLLARLAHGDRLRVFFICRIGTDILYQVGAPLQEREAFHGGSA